MTHRTRRIAWLWQAIGVSSLTVAALVALRQSYRVRRSMAETAPPEPVPLPTPPPHVSIILPVRNEEAHIDGVLASLLAQDYPDVDVTAIDDGSTDTTPAKLAAWAARDQRLHVHRIDRLPAGWAGKTHALHIGMGLTEGAWLLFTDADTRHAPQTLRLMVGHALVHGDDLLSMFTEVRLIGPAMRLLTPIGALTLVERATPREVRDPSHARALAVGQYLLVRRDAYVASGGYGAPGMRDTFAEDVALAELFKRHGRRIDIVDGHSLVSNEQWTTWKSAWRGWRKSAYSEVARRPLTSLVAGLLMLLYGLGPLITLLRPSIDRRRWFPTMLAALTVAAQIDARAHFDRHADLSALWSLSAPLGWVVFGLLLLDTVRLVLTGRGADWKGRLTPRR